MRTFGRLPAAALCVALSAAAACASPQEGGAPAPQPAAPAAAHRILPQSVDFVLADGMRVFLVPDHEVPLVSFEVRLAGGCVEDPPGREGAAALASAILTKGAGDRDTKAFDEAVELVGGQFASSVGPRWISVSAQFLKGDLDLALELLGDVLLRPRLDPAEFEKEKGLAIDGLAAARQEPQSLLGRYFSRWVYSGHAYERPFSGDEASLAALTLDDVRAAAGRHLSPRRAWLAVAGDFDPADMRKRLESAFGGWVQEQSETEPPVAQVPAWNGTSGGRVLLVDKADSIQTYFRFGNRGFDRSDPDYVARQAANSTLGGRFTSRLNKTLRTEKGFTYGAGSGFDDDRQGLFFVYSQGTDTSMTAECLPLADAIYRKFLEGGMTAEELAATKAYLRGQYGPGFETGEQQAGAILDLEFDGLSRDLVDGFLDELDSLTLEDVNRVIRERFPKALDWVVIGRADACRETAAKFGAVTECSITDPGFGPARPE